MDRRWRSAAWPSRSGFLRKYRDEVMSRLERDSSGGNSGKGGNMEAGDRCASLHALRVSTGGEGKGSVRRLIGWMTCLGVSGLVLWLMGACAALDTVNYYWQSAAGQWDLLSRARPIYDVIAETDDAGLKIRLRRIAEMRAFASRELALPSNGSSTRYTDLGRPFVSWTVFATPELSLAARRWCFPIAGCVGYRGYFRETQAQDEALRLQADGDDVYIGHIPAYSTLGYFDDPILSSFVRWPETDVARLIFHELAHQLFYVPGDTVFNESYAVTVESAGLERWLAHEHKPELWNQFERSERTRAEFDALVRESHAHLAAIYASSATAAEKRRRKVTAFSDLRRARGKRQSPPLLRPGATAWQHAEGAARSYPGPLSGPR